MSWRFHWVTDWDEVFRPPFLDRWRQLLAAADDPHPYHHPELVRAWSATRGAALGARPLFAVAEPAADDDAAGPRLLLPWVVVPAHGRLVTRRLLEAAGGPLAGRHDPLVAGDRRRIDWGALWGAARRQAARAGGGAVADQALFRALPAACGGGGWGRPAADPSPYLDLTPFADLDDCLAAASANLRGDVRRRLRRLAERGEVDLWLPGPEEARAARDDLLGAFLPAYRALWSEQPEGDLLERAGLPEYVERLVDDGLAGGWVSYAALRLDGRPIAWHVGPLFRGSLYWWLSAYDPAESGSAPGKVLLALLVGRGIELGWRGLDFQTGGQRYKLAWRPALPPLVTVGWHAPTLRGRLLALYDRRRGGGGGGRAAAETDGVASSGEKLERGQR